MNCVSVESSRNDHHKIERWYSEDALPAMSHHIHGTHTTPIDCLLLCLIEFCKQVGIEHA